MVLFQEAADAISEEYARLRSVADVTEGSAKTIPITARTLETLIRISTAHAKCRLSKKIEARDAEAAIELIQYAYFAKVVIFFIFPISIGCLGCEKARQKEEEG